MSGRPSSFAASFGDNTAGEQCGISKTEAARLFDVSLSPAKHYSRMARQGNSLAPKKRPGRTPKVDEKAEKLPRKR